MKKENEIEVDEKLGKYFNCLSHFYRRVWRLEELQIRTQYNVQTMDDNAFNALHETTLPLKSIKQCHNYSIVSNPKYAAMFQYTPIEMRDTEEEKINSEAVLKVLNLAYIQ